MALAHPASAEDTGSNAREPHTSCTDHTSFSYLCFSLINSDAMLGAENTGPPHTPLPYYILTRHGEAWSISVRSVGQGRAEDQDEDWTTLETRQISRPVDLAAAREIIAMLQPPFVDALDATTPYPGDMICLDGSVLTVMANLPGVSGKWQKHSCNENTKLDEVEQALRNLALKVDPTLARFER